ncbi:putative Multidrug resistance protein NorM [Magnetospira sp. QH-2]|nr:putative Multidrug resistance protein NorM [Magnetospira sp. QH-2]
MAELSRLAWPVIISRSGIMVMALVDTVMVGRYSTTELAYQGLGWAPATTLTLIGIGLLLGTLVLAAEATGGGRDAESGAAWRHGMTLSLVVGVPCAVLSLFGEEFFLLTGQTPGLAEGSGRVMAVFGLGIPLTFTFFATTFFLEGIGRPLPGMIAMAIANVGNMGLNWLLIGGEMGFPALGAEGAAWGTTIARGVVAVGLVIYLWFMADHARFAVRQRAKGGWAGWKLQRQLGYAAGIAIGAESLAFGLVNVFAGWLGEEALAAFSIAFNMMSVVFTAALGIGAAAAVRVGTAWGRKDPADMALAGWVGISANTAVMILCGGSYILFAEALVGIYSTDPAIIALAIPLVYVAALALIPDGGQVVMANALRGRGETWATTAIQSFVYLGLMIPGTWALAIPLGRGPVGLFEGILLASLVSIGLLAWRFQVLARRDRNRA